MCEWGNYDLVAVGGRNVQIDSCIAELVRVLNENGFATIASCCGHGKRPGSIVLADGRHIEILADRTMWETVQAAYKAAGLFEAKGKK